MPKALVRYLALQAAPNMRRQLQHTSIDPHPQVAFLGTTRRSESFSSSLGFRVESTWRRVAEVRRGQVDDGDGAALVVREDRESPHRDYSILYYSISVYVTILITYTITYTCITHYTLLFYYH